MTHLRRQLLIPFAATVLSVGSGNAQQSESRPTETDGSPRATRELTQEIRWPEDRARVICVVSGTEYTVQDLVAHLETYHFPGLGNFLDEPAGQYYFGNPIVARWVRQFADVLALRNEAAHRGIDTERARPELEAALKRGFELFLDNYVREEAKRGRTDELSQQRVNNLLTHFQNHFGLETEVGGWLSLLVEEPTTEDDDLLRDYYHDHVQYFGGRVTASVILVRNRDPRTGALYVGEKRKEFIKRLSDVESRLAEDGSNFEEVARLLSEDQVTSGEGGILRSIPRFDSTLPPAVCREVWGLPNGKWTGPFESEFGVHFVKRLDYVHREYIIYTDKIEPMVIDTIVKHRRESMLYRVRREQRVELRY